MSCEDSARLTAASWLASRPADNTYGSCGPVSLFRQVRQPINHFMRCPEDTLDKQSIQGQLQAMHHVCCTVDGVHVADKANGQAGHQNLHAAPDKAFWVPAAQFKMVLARHSVANACHEVKAMANNWWWTYWLKLQSKTMSSN